MSSVLTLVPINPADIPSEDVLLDAARQVLDSTNSWKQGKTYAKYSVKSFFTPKGPGDTPWHCRVSEHSSQDATFDEMWSKLGGSDKAVNEHQFIPEIKKVTLIKSISSTQSIWSMYYTFPPPISPRVFTVLQVVHLDESAPRTGIIVSIPIDLRTPGDEALAELEEKGVKGRYVSVEQIKELEDGRVEWRMATSSTPGGSIPTFIAEASISGSIAKDVPHFMAWLHDKHPRPATGE